MDRALMDWLLKGAMYLEKAIQANDVATMQRVLDILEVAVRYLALLEEDDTLDD